MPTILGYLRRYTRWDGTPGLSLEEQRAIVNRIARVLDGGGERYFTGRSYHTEATDGAAKRWPILNRLINRAREDAELDVVLVIPTLDGIRFNVSFLELLAADDCNGGPIFVYSGRLRAGALRKNTNHGFRAMRNFWWLALGDHWSAFNELVEKVRWRQRALPKAIKAGLRDAADRGAAIGAQRRGAHRFIAAERSKGGCATATKRRLAANKPYQEWIPEIRRLRQAGRSIGQITRLLADKGARTPDGRKLGPMLIWRILKRSAGARTEMRSVPS